MELLQGRLLIASSRLVDPNFFRSIVLLVQHSEEDGALGLILNRPLKMTVRSAWAQISQSPCQTDGFLYQGGPCEGPLMALHTVEEFSQHQVLPGLFFSTEKESVEELVGAAEGWRQFFIGYAGWTAGQLESEIKEGGWLTSATTLQQVQEGNDEKWNLLRKLATRSAAFPWIDPATFPTDPSNN
jgi:putative transcriptional regulator